jgi:hypothetical protein
MILRLTPGDHAKLHDELMTRLAVACNYGRVDYCAVVPWF